MIRGPEVCHPLGSPAACCSHQRLPSVQSPARPVPPRRVRRALTRAQLSLGDQVTKQERLCPGDRVTSSRHCSTSYTAQADSYCICGRPLLTGRALQWWDKLEAHSATHSLPRHRHQQATCALAVSSSNGSNGGSAHTDSRKRSTTVAAAKSTEHSNGNGKKVLQDSDLPKLGKDDPGSEQPPETGFVAQAQVTQMPDSPQSAARSASAQAGTYASSKTMLYPAKEQGNIKESWKTLMRWSKVFKRPQNGLHVLDKTDKVVIFGGGSFGTAMGVALARQRSSLSVSLLLRDAYVCRDINSQHENTRYLPDMTLPHNISATTSMAEAIAGASYAVHALPVQHSRLFLQAIKDVLPPDVPIISVSKGLEVGTGKMMSELIVDVLGRKHPCCFLSGPSFAKEVMTLQPTGVVAASKDPDLARDVQQLFASPYMRVNTTTDVTGVEICGALKNVLAIAAGIVEGLDLGHNAMAALVAQGAFQQKVRMQGCAEIRWLAEKMGAKPSTVSGLSGLGDIMLTCYGSLSRNRTVGVRLGAGESLNDILSSSKQVAEGVTTAGVVVTLARKYRVSLPVLTAVAQVLNGHLNAKEAVFEIMNLPQIEER